MTTSLLYWILMLLWLILGIWASWPLTNTSLKSHGEDLIIFLLFVLLGWRVFGAPIV